MKKSLKTTQDKLYWEFVEFTAKEVARWPSWMRDSIKSQVEKSASVCSSGSSVAEKNVREKR